MSRLWSLLVIGMILGAGSTAGAQQAGTPLFRSEPPSGLYRSGLPEVIEPRPQADLRRERVGVIAAFARAYGEQHSPRIALFWNRSFDDRLSDWRSAVRVTTTRDVQLNAMHRRDGGGQGLVVLGDGDENAIDVRLRDRRVSELEVANLAPARHQLPAGTEAGLRSGFTQTLLEAGAVLVNRAMIMRLTQDAGGGGAVDSQQIETRALLGHADLVVEVMLQPSSGAPLDMTCQVNVKEVATGRIIASVTGGRAAMILGAGGWQAVEGGFRREERVASPHEVGGQVALDTMAALQRTWR